MDFTNEEAVVGGLRLASTPPLLYCSICLQTLGCRRQKEKELNSFPQFKSSIDDSEAGTVDIHYVALFSQKPNAIPIICEPMHDGFLSPTTIIANFNRSAWMARLVCSPTLGRAGH